MRYLDLRSYLGDRVFYQKALAVMIPVILQQLISALFNFTDNFMVASINDLSMAAVNVANKPSMLYYSLFFGFTGAAGILLAQYAGAGRMDVCRRIFSLEMLIGLLFACVFCGVLLLFNKPIMAIFVSDAYTISIGVAYREIVAWAFLPAAVSSVCVFSLRAMGINRLPMQVSIFAIACNAFCNWVLIFGKLGFPQMGVRGAALGTLVARGIEMCIYVAVLLTKRTPFDLNLAQARKIDKPLMWDYMRRALPLTANEILWSAGLMIYFWTYSHLSETSVRALSLADQMYSISFVLVMGTSSAVSVIVGKALGAGDFRAAKDNAKKLMGMGFAIALMGSLLGVTLSLFIGRICTTFEPDQIRLARHLVWIMLCFFPTNTVYGICFFLLRAGGDTKNAMRLDAGYMWLVPVPIAVLMGWLLPGKIDIRLAFFVIQVLMNAKLIWALRVVKRGGWLQNITRPEEA